MVSSVDFRLAELLASRLCHDLVGPVSAVGNGAELLQEMSPMDAEAVDLIASSSGQAASKLAFFRLAYGAAGERINSIEDLRPVIEDWLKEERLELRWPQEGARSLSGYNGKVLLNLLALARECLPRGGELDLSLWEKGDLLELELKGQGATMELRSDTAEGLVEQVSPDSLTPRNVHAFFTRQLIIRTGGDLKLDTDSTSTEAGLTISVHLPV